MAFDFATMINAGGIDLDPWWVMEQVRWSSHRTAESVKLH